MKKTIISIFILTIILAIFSINTINIILIFIFKSPLIIIGIVFLSIFALLRIIRYIKTTVTQPISTVTKIIEHLSKKGSYIITFSCGGAFIGSLTGYTPVLVITALTGAVYGIFFEEENFSSDTDYIFAKRENYNNIWERTKQMIVIVSGCTLIGGFIGQFPGSIIGLISGVVLSLVTKNTINN